ncbi:MAG: PAS domain S-box protein, partial [Desulfohalobiaceae bacterium]|nr:PAS domain S-box protein [Desulfohalobiaceae bacterium]
MSDMKFPFPQKIALQFAVFGGLWIVVTDLIAEYFWSDIMPYAALQTVKGLLFILATSLFIFFLLQRESRRIAAAEKKALEHASRHRSAFDSSPEPLWEEDFSGVKAALDALRDSGVEDIEAYLDAHPEFVSECIRKIRVIDVNQAAVAYHEAESRSELLQSLPLIFTEASWPGLKQEILAMARGEIRFDVQVTGQTLSGRPLEFIVRWSVLTGHEDTFDRVYLAASDVTELSWVKKELEASEQKYRVLVEHAGEAVMVIQNQTIRFANAAATTLTGLPHDQLLGSGLGPLLHPEDREWVLDRHRRRLAGEDPLTRYSLRMICAKGQIRWVEISVVRIEWSGQPSVLMIASDITERKKEQEELQNTKNLLEKIFNNLEEAVLLVDPPERRIVACNPAVENIFGYGQDELTGRSTQILHTDEKSFEKFMELMSPGLGGKGPFHTKYRMRRKDSQEIITEITVTAIDELLGWGRGVISVIRDITAQESAEKSLRESEKKYRTLLENATESVVVIQDWRIVFCNQQFKETTGFQAEDLQGASFRDLVYRDDFPSFEALINRLQSGGGQSPRDIEFRIKDNRSGLLWMRANAVGLDWNDRAAVMALLNDITDQKALEQQNKEMEARMLQAQKLESIGTLAGGISHDFNNLLSVILGFSRLARDELSEGDPMRKHLSTVVEAGERAVELVEQILTFSRREKEDKHPFQIHVIIKEALKMLRTSIPPHIEIQQDIRTEKYVLMDVTADTNRTHPCRVLKRPILIPIDIPYEFFPCFSRLSYGSLPLIFLA